VWGQACEGFFPTDLNFLTQEYLIMADNSDFEMLVQQQMENLLKEKFERTHLNNEVWSAQCALITNQIKERFAKTYREAEKSGEVNDTSKEVLDIVKNYMRLVELRFCQMDGIIRRAKRS
jgi:hypothetical protein